MTKELVPLEGGVRAGIVNNKVIVLDVRGVGKSLSSEETNTPDNTYSTRLMLQIVPLPEKLLLLYNTAVTTLLLYY